MLLHSFEFEHYLNSLKLSDLMQHKNYSANRKLMIEKTINEVAE